MMPQLKRILYTTDLSPNSVFVLRYAINSAKKHGAKLVILPLPAGETDITIHDE